MLKSYFKIALRDLKRHKAFSLINISGLAVGMACCLVMVLFIHYELSYDTYHTKAERIYRVLREAGTDTPFATTPFVLAPTLATDYPEIQAVRFHQGGALRIRVGEDQFYQNDLFWADATVFDVFSFPLLRGDPQTALQDPFSIVVTEAVAQKYFGEADPIGKQLFLSWADETYPLTITGILQPIPRRSHFTFGGLISFATSEQLFSPPTFFTDWSLHHAYTYLLLPEDMLPAELEAQFPAFVGRHVGEEAQSRYTEYLAALQPLTAIHLRSNVGREIAPPGDITYVYIAGVLALLIVLIACINYINLTTARFAGRAKEVGMRKVLGAPRRQLIAQFLGESLVITGLALGAALALLHLSLPLFNELLDKDLSPSVGGYGVVVAGLLALMLLVGIGAGSYPAFYLSAFSPAASLKGKLNGAAGPASLRKILVVAQFAMSIGLIGCTFVLADQVDYVRGKQLGFNKDQVVVIPQARAVRDRTESVKRAFLEDPNVASVTVSSYLPTRPLSVVGSAYPEGAQAVEAWPVPLVSVDYDFWETYEIDLVEGRLFSTDFATDSTEALVLNEAAVRHLGWEAPIGKQIRLRYNSGAASVEERIGRVVGVVKDVHFESLRQEIGPLIFLNKPYWYFYLSVRIRSEQAAGTLAGLRRTWEAQAPEQPFEYFFLDDRFESLYAAEEAWRRGIGLFSVLAVFIACLGLFGYLAFATEKRTKEIGVRKVLGASVPEIVLLLSKDYFQLVGIAFIIATPVAYLAMSRWLQQFAYRTALSWEVFLLAGLIALLVAALIIGYQALKAALANPIESLRHE